MDELTGRTFGRWTVLSEDTPRIRTNGERRRYWLCRCECNTERPVYGENLKRGITLSCGCYHRERARDSHITHGKANTPEYSVWCGIKRRCDNPHERGYPLYGGRGIKVCERWQTFENFLADMGSRPTPKHTIERIDTRGDYEPSNCCWATQLEQQNNRSDNRLIEHLGRTQTLAQWSRETGLTSGTICRRLERGWPVDLALTLPKRPGFALKYRKETQDGRHGPRSE